MKLYKKARGHTKQHVGSCDLADFFSWALKLCRRDEADRVMVETPDWRITWTLPKRPLKRRLAKATKRTKVKTDG